MSSCLAGCCLIGPTRIANEEIRKEVSDYENYLHDIMTNDGFEMMLLIENVDEGSAEMLVEHVEKGKFYDEVVEMWNDPGEVAERFFETDKKIMYYTENSYSGEEMENHEFVLMCIIDGIPKFKEIFKIS